MRYNIAFTDDAKEDLQALRAFDRTEVLDAIEVHLRYEPEKTSQSRIKRLEGLGWPQYRLRIGDIRAFYDVYYARQGGTVLIVAIMEKSAAMRWLAEHGRPET